MCLQKTGRLDTFFNLKENVGCFGFFPNLWLA